MNLSSPLTVLYNRETLSLYYKEESTANSNSFKIAQKPLLRQNDDYTPQVR